MNCPECGLQFDRGWGRVEASFSIVSIDEENVVLGEPCVYISGGEALDGNFILYCSDCDTEETITRGISLDY